MTRKFLGYLILAIGSISVVFALAGAARGLTPATATLGVVLGAALLGVALVLILSASEKSPRSTESLRRRRMTTGIAFAAGGVLALGWVIFSLVSRPEDGFPGLALAFAALYLMFGLNYIAPWRASVISRWPKPPLAEGEDYLWGARAAKVQGKHSRYPGGLSLTSERLVFVSNPNRGPTTGERTEWPVSLIASVELARSYALAVQGESTSVLTITFDDGSSAQFRTMDAAAAKRDLSTLLATTGPRTAARG